MLRRNVIRAAVVLGTLGATTGCTQIEDFLTRNVKIFSYLRDSPAYDAYQAPRPAPEGSVPFASPAGDVPRPTTVAGPAGLQELAARVENPAPMNEASVEAGRELFERYCAVCHNSTAAGNGPAVGPNRIPFAPSLLTPTAQAHSDGYIYAIIALGRGLMPAYQRVEHMERWHIVNYVRSLQQQAGAAPATPATTAPAATAPATATQQGGQ